MPLAQVLPAFSIIAAASIGHTLSCPSDLRTRRITCVGSLRTKARKCAFRRSRCNARACSAHAQANDTQTVGTALRNLSLDALFLLPRPIADGAAPLSRVIITIILSNNVKSFCAGSQKIFSWARSPVHTSRSAGPILVSTPGSFLGSAEAS